MKVVVKWETLIASQRGGEARYVQHKTFRSETARADAEMFTRHIVMGEDPEWYSIEEKS